MIAKPTSFLFFLVLALSGRPTLGDDHLCFGVNNTFTAKVDLFASEYGYFYFEECGDTVNPTLALEIGETYTFIQNDRTNFKHPLGFAYFPGGAHDDMPELEPAVSPEVNGVTSSCVGTATCPAPMYFVGGEYAGVYSNIESVKNTTTLEEDFGLDAYEPLFFFPLGEWMDRGPYSVQLKFDDASYTQDIFYFCHIHQFMSGRIKLTQNGVAINAEDTPELGFEYQTQGTFDQTCGTYDIDEFRLPNRQCPERFVCETDSATSELQQFSSCIDALNCHMVAGMTTGVKANNEMVLFFHQMIPHHQNAVNMAKALLHTGKINCDDLAEESVDCVVETMLREIINGQNEQIHTMRGLLQELDAPEKDDCIVDILPTGVTDDAPRATETGAPTTEAPSPVVSSAVQYSGNLLRGLGFVLLVVTCQLI